MEHKYSGRDNLPVLGLNHQQIACRQGQSHMHHTQHPKNELTDVTRIREINWCKIQIEKKNISIKKYL